MSTHSNKPSNNASWIQQSTNPEAETSDWRGKRQTDHPKTSPSQEIPSPTAGLAGLSFIATALCVLVGAVYLYTSTAAKEPTYPAPISEELFRQIPAPVTHAAIESPPTPTEVVIKPSFRPNAVIDVPSVGLRNTPAMAADATVGSLSRGESVEIIGRNSDNGPDWVKIRTRSGKVGWVFASVVKEHNRR